MRGALIFNCLYILDLPIEENIRTLGSLFAHQSTQELQQWHTTPSPFGHQDIDQRFSTDYASLYTTPQTDFNTLAYQTRGEQALAFGYYEQAVYDFGKAIDLNPSNPVTYLERGIARFGLGEYDRSLEDYRQFASQTQKTYPLSVPEFSLGFAKGFPKGSYESGEGLVRFVSDLVIHPIHTGEQIWDALGLLSNLVRSEEWQTLSQVIAPEVHQLVKEWDALPSEKRGELAGYAFGKYGADILLPGALAKATSKGFKGIQELSTVYKRLKNAEKTLILESVSNLKNGQKIAEVIHSKTAIIAEKLGFNVREVAQLENIGKIEGNIGNVSKNILLIVES